MPSVKILPFPEGFANGGFQAVVRALSGEQISLPLFNLNLTPFLPQFYLILISFLVSNHGLQTTVYRPLVFVECMNRVPKGDAPWRVGGGFERLVL